MHELMTDFETITPELWIANEKLWTDKLLNLPNWYQIPLINCNASHNLPDKTLVRFRGMIQDMHDTEFYFEEFEVYNNNTNETKIKSGKYQDTSNILENEKINYASNLKCAQRRTMVVVSLPGLNDWAQQLEDEQNHLKHLEQLPNTSNRLTQNPKLKRRYDEADEGLHDMEVVNETVANKEQKIVNTSDYSKSVVSREHLLNFPLPDVPSKSCIVKIYEAGNGLTDDLDALKLNDMIEVVGFLSIDPALSGEFQPEKDTLLDPVIESEVETITHNPPPSLIPRLHAVYVKKLDHCNPLVNDPFDQVATLGKANEAREHLLKALTELLLGDQLAAEYLICHLIACVYRRVDTMTLGHFCLNLFNLPIQKYPNYAKQLYDIIKQFVTKSYYLPLTIDNLNTLCLLPKKDYDCNRLTSGLLQLSKDTHLILDETKMEEGRLDATGVNNVAALSHLIEMQKVEYDFKYYKMEFDADIPVLVLSEGKSLLPIGCQIPLQPEESSLQIFDATLEAATYYLKEDIMNIIRTYITNLKLVEFDTHQELKFVDDDITEMLGKKSTSDNPVTTDDLHRLFILARLLSLSRGFNELNKECWDTMKDMEAQRLRRLKNRVAPTL